MGFLMGKVVVKETMEIHVPAKRIPEFIDCLRDNGYVAKNMSNTDSGLTKTITEKPYITLDTASKLVANSQAQSQFKKMSIDEFMAEASKTPYTPHYADTSVTLKWMEKDTIKDLLHRADKIQDGAFSITIEPENQKQQWLDFMFQARGVVAKGNIRNFTSVLAARAEKLKHEAPKVIATNALEWDF